MNMKSVKFTKLEDQNNNKKKQQYDESIKMKKNQLKSQFEQLEEIRKCEQISVQESNNVKLKNQLNSVQNAKYYLQNKLESLQNKLVTLQAAHKSSQSIDVISNQESEFLIPQNSQLVFSTIQHSTKVSLYQGSSQMTQEIFDFQMRIIQQEQARVDGLLENETMQTDLLKKEISEIKKDRDSLSKQTLQLNQLRAVQEIQFKDAETIHFISKEKQSKSKANLKEIKKEISEIDKIEQVYQKNQQETRDNLKKQILIGEEFVSHYQIKIEEAESKIQESNAIISNLENEYDLKMLKREESKYVLTYIQFFKLFHDYFIINCEPIQQLIDNPPLESQNSSDILEVVRQILEYTSQQQFSVEDIQYQVIKTYWNLVTNINSNNIKYENLLMHKQQITNQFDELQEFIQNIQLNNQYNNNNDDEIVSPVKLRRRSINQDSDRIIKQFDCDQQVSADTGLILKDQEIFTLNVKQHDIQINQEGNINQQISAIQNNIFHFYLSISESLLRICQTIQLVDANSGKLFPVNLQELIEQTLTFLTSIWRGSSEQKQQPDKQIKNKPNLLQVQNNEYEELKSTSKKSKDNQSNKFTDELTDSVYDKQVVQPELVNYQEIVQSYINIFQCDREDAIKWSMLCKKDKLIWFFISKDNCTSFLNKLKLKYGKIQGVRESLWQISRYRDELSLILFEKINTIFNYYTNIFVGIKQSSIQILELIKEIDSKFQLKIDKNQKDSQTAKDAMKKCIQKILNYRNYQDQDYTHLENSRKSIVAIQNQPEKNDKHDFLATTSTINNKRQPQDVKMSEDQINQYKEYFRSQTSTISKRSLFESKIKKDKTMIQKQEFKQKPKLEKYIADIDNDVFEEERDQQRTIIEKKINDERIRLEKIKNKIPEVKEDEHVTKIKEITKRLYQEKGFYGTQVKNYQIAATILRDIVCVDKKSLQVENKAVVNKYKEERKNISNSLNKDNSLPILNYLIPTNSYKQRRNESETKIEQIQLNKYSLLGDFKTVPIKTASTIKTKKERKAQILKQESELEQFKKKYRDQRTTNKFIHSMMSIDLKEDIYNY